MPTALSTTKRKFHKLLDSISNASPSPSPFQQDRLNASSVTLPTSAAPPAESPLKKPRVTRPFSAHAGSSATAQPRLVSHAKRPISITAGNASKPDPASTNSVAQTEKAPNQLPNFAPWDRGQFLSRLKTFRHVDKWTGKPDRINEVEWAKRGWSCVGKETVGCIGGCNKEVVIELEDEHGERSLDAERDEEGEEEVEQEWRQEAQTELVGRYAEMISTAHEGGCLWRRRGCDDTIQRLPVIQYAPTIEELRLRYRSLLAMSTELPHSVTAPPHVDLSKMTKHLDAILNISTPAAQDSTQLQSSDTSQSSSTSSLNSVAMLLALFGWQAEEEHVIGLASCNACFRRLGLWLFRSSAGSPNENETSAMDRLDVVSEHRDYCPWVNPVSQNGGSRRSSLDRLAGWETLLRTVFSRSAGEGDREQATSSPKAPVGGEEAGISEGTTNKSQNALNQHPRITAEEDEESRRQKQDKERWAKLRKVRQVFQVKPRINAVPTPVPKANGSELTT